MYHKDIYRSRSVAGVPPAVRPDLRVAADHDWALIPIDARFVWQSIGPSQGVAGTTVASTPSDEPISGLVADIAVGSSPSNVWIGTRNGGVWKTTAYSQTRAPGDPQVPWTPLTDGMPSLQTVAISVVETSGDPILLAATGETTNTQLRNAGLVGLYRSVDGGKTWCIADGGSDATIFQSNDINEVIAIDANKILVATRAGLFYSKDGGRNFGTPPDHQDGQPILPGFVSSIVRLGNDVGAAVGGDPIDAPDPIPPEVVGLGLPGNDTFGLYTATLAASTLPGPAIRHRTLARVGDPHVGMILLARRDRSWLMSVAPGVQLRNDDSVPLVHHHSIQFTRNDVGTDSGWGILATDPDDSRQSSYSHAIALEAGAGPDFFAWFGTVPLSRRRISLVGGRWTWSPVANEDEVHADEHVVHTPDSGTHVMSGNDGGLYATNDQGTATVDRHWVSHNAHTTTLFWSLALRQGDTADRLRVMAGLQDNGTITGEGPASTTDPTSWTWRYISGGDGGNTAFVPESSPPKAYITLNGMLRKADMGATINDWTVNDFGTPEFPFSETVVMARAPGGAWERVYFARSEVRNGPGRLFRRDGSGSLVQKYPPGRDPLPNEPMITALATAPADASTEHSTPGEWRHLWVGFSDGGLQFSSDAGESFIPHATSGIGPVTGIAVDPDDSRRVVVVHAGFSEPTRAQASKHVFLTEDGGATFRDISGRRNTTDGFVPDVPILAVAFGRTNPATILLATDLGVLVTTDSGAHWKRLGVGLPKVPCTAIGVVNPPASVDRSALTATIPPLVLATWGRGAWVLRAPTTAQAYVDFDGGFGPVKTGSTVRRTLTLYNVGNAPLRITAGSVTAPFSFPTPPTTPIPPGGSVNWDVSCAPTADGIFAAAITLTVDSGPAITGVNASCEAVSTGLPRLAIWPRTMALGDVTDGTTVTDSIQLANRGVADLTITNVVVDPATASSFHLDLPAGTTLAPGEQRSFPLRYVASGVGSARGQWTLVCNDPANYPNRRVIRASANTVAPGATSDGGMPWWGWVLIGAGVAVGAVAGILIYEKIESDSHH